jgi:hypothetical protein
LESKDVNTCIVAVSQFYRRAETKQLAKIQDVLDYIADLDFEDLAQAARKLSDDIVSLLHSRQSRDERQQRDDSIMFVIQRLDIVLMQTLETILERMSNKRISFSDFKQKNVWAWLESDAFMKIGRVSQIDAQLRKAYDKSEIKKRLDAPLSSRWAGDYAQSWMREFFLANEGEDAWDLDPTEGEYPSKGAELVKEGDAVTVRFSSDIISAQLQDR